MKAQTPKKPVMVMAFRIDPKSLADVRRQIRPLEKEIGSIIRKMKQALALGKRMEDRWRSLAGEPLKKARVTR